MDIKQQILHFYRVEGLSLREISRRAGVDRKTVMRLINDYEAAIKANPETGVDDFLASRPKYSKRAYANSNHREVNRQYYPTEQLRQSNAIKKNDSTHKA